MRINVVDYLLDAIFARLSGTAVHCSTCSISFGQLREAAARIATVVGRQVGFNSRKPVAVYMEKSWEALACFLGIAWSGNFYSPIDVHSPLERIQRIFNVLSPSLILSMTETPFHGTCDQQFFESAIDTTPDFILLERSRCNIIDTDPLYVLFTSGSTGQPKGVVISHRGVIDYTEWLHDTFAFDENTVFGQQAPFYFDNSILDIYSTLRSAATMVLIPEQKFLFAGKLLEYLAEQKVNTLFWVPSALCSVADAGALERAAALPPLQKILFCGEVMPNKQLNAWRRAYPDAMFANLYGPTEITDVCAYYLVNRSFRDDEPLPIGRACRNTQILVFDEQNSLVTAPGVLGELCVRGSCLSMGYYRDPERTAPVFVQNPCNMAYADPIYRTGDLVRYNSHGELEYVCRKDFQIKHQGHRIELGEIEAAVGALAGVRQCCALYNGAAKKIHLVFSAAGVSEKELYQKLKNRLPRYMLPSVIHLLDVLPLNANGKIDRKKLQEEFFAHEARTD